MGAPAPLFTWRRPGLSGAGLGLGSVAVVLVTALVGFLLVSQVRGTHRITQQLSSENAGDLTRILSRLNTQADDLRDEVGTLKLQLVDLQNSSQHSDAAVETAREQLQSLEVLAGTVPVTGPGLTLVIQDPSAAVGADNLIDVIEELRDAGADALAINGVRVGVRSSFSTAGGHLLIDASPLSPPYRISAIGEPDTLDSGLRIPGGALDTLGALKDASADVQREAKVDLPALALPPTFKVAHPIGSQP